MLFSSENLIYLYTLSFYLQPPKVLDDQFPELPDKVVLEKASIASETSEPLKILELSMHIFSSSGFKISSLVLLWNRSSELLDFYFLVLPDSVRSEFHWSTGAHALGLGPIHSCSPCSSFNIPSAIAAIIPRHPAHLLRWATTGIPTGAQ
jgi:hypothetical protein